MPEVWKKSFITPIFKSGDKHDISNYRPIAIIGSIAKIFDLIVTNKSTDQCISLIINNQHGFVKGRSIVTNLLLYSNYISQALDKYRQVDSIYLDFAKAFDKVDHNILLFKLHKLGINSHLIGWLKSYLFNRTLSVRIRGNVSSPFIAHSGVPQGSHLGSLLFLFFIKDINNHLRVAEILVYADDIKLYKMITSFYDQVLLQKDLESISEWGILNRVTLNCDKSKVITFNRSAKNLLQYRY